MTNREPPPDFIAPLRQYLRREEMKLRGETPGIAGMTHIGDGLYVSDTALRMKGIEKALKFLRKSP
jgi:hypothetical protein